MLFACLPLAWQWSGQGVKHVRFLVSVDNLPVFELLVEWALHGVTGPIRVSLVKTPSMTTLSLGSLKRLLSSLRCGLTEMLLVYGSIVMPGEHVSQHMWL